MRIRQFHTETVIPHPRAVVFWFFGDTQNLNVITPEWLHFEIRTPTPVLMNKGAIVEYKLRLYGIPFPWISEITEWEPPNHFVDVQRKGPYRQWVHRHEFIEIDGGTRMIDHVEYAVPGLFLEPVINKFWVARDIERIFAYRQEKLLQHMGL